MLHKIEDELKKRNLEDVSTDKLLELFIKYSDKVQGEIVEPVFKTSEDMKEDKEERQLINNFTFIQAIKN